MISYQYQILRYRRDIAAEEFVNIGVVVYCKERKYLECKTINKYARITAFFEGVDGKFIMSLIKSFQIGLQQQSENIKGLFDNPETLQEITDRILPYDDSSFYLSESKSGIDVEPNRCLKNLYRLFVSNNDQDIDETIDNDQDVWRFKFKKFFDEYDITNKLTNYEIDTKHDSFKFDKAWKNEVWHCYQPLAFNLKHADSIKNKVYKWVGKIQEIKTSKEVINLTFLSSAPKFHQELKDFISQTLNEQSDQIKVSIVYEEDAKQLATDLRNYIEKHNN